VIVTGSGDLRLLSCIGSGTKARRGRFEIGRRTPLKDVEKFESERSLTLTQTIACAIREHFRQPNFAPDVSLAD
jgi:hypothetical protein